MNDYKEIKTNLIESSSLFQRSLGEETEIIEKEMFELLNKKESTSISSSNNVLRPENTSGVMRWFLENKEKEKEKLYYIGRMFRYERP